MKRGKTLACSLILTTLLTAANALATGWSDSMSIAHIEVNSTTVGNGTLSYVLLSGNYNTNRPTCGGGSSVYNELSGSADHVKSMTTIATAAYLAGKQIKIYWDGTCDGVYPKVAFMELE